jgi:hypothetical protein
MKKTEWFPANIYPVHVGFYETSRNHVAKEAEGIHKLYWNGEKWQYAYDCGECFKGERAIMYASDGDKWRGLAEKAS